MSNSETALLAVEGSHQFDGYISRPESGRGTGLLIFCEMFGLNDVMRNVADRYASKGHCVLVPNVFWRSDPPRALGYEGEDREIAWARLRDFDFERSAADIAMAARWLRDDSGCTGKVAALGFCMGGRLAFLAASRSLVDAAISFYALGIVKHLDEASQVSCPLQLHYGLEDRHVPRSEIEAVERAVRDNDAIEICLYPTAGHSFFNAVRPTFDAMAARVASERVDRLLAALVR